MESVCARPSSVNLALQLRRCLYELLYCPAHSGVLRCLLVEAQRFRDIAVSRLSIPMALFPWL